MEPLYGRAPVLGKARACLERARAGAGRLVLFSGEPGIGKSRLAEQIAHEASAQGATVAWGRCWEAGGAPAYWPWIQMFRELGMDQDPFAGAATGLAVFTPEARFAAFDSAVRSLRSLATERPLVLVLDDLHAADAPSLLLLLLLARELARSGILVVGAYRDAELRSTPEIATLTQTRAVLEVAAVLGREFSLFEVAETPPWTRTRCTRRSVRRSRRTSCYRARASAFVFRTCS
ncbi:MAG TPA: ATP-binding protein [Polyangiaceae bacterium]